MEEADACPTQCACTEWVEDEVLEAGGRREVVADACQCRGGGPPLREAAEGMMIE